MTAGDGLGGMEAAKPRGRGRPKGSKNRRAADLKGLIDARYGGSAAMQAAQAVMITPKELRDAGGSMGRAQVNKALALVEYVRDAKGRLDQALQAMVREAVEDLAAQIGGAEGAELRKKVNAFIHRIEHLGGDFGLNQALKLLADERAALLPYTDQRQPQAVQLEGMNGPSVVVMAMEGSGLPMLAADPVDADFIEVFDPAAGQVSPAKSHDDAQPLVLPGLEPPRDAD